MEVKLKISSINYPTPLEACDVICDNIDVFVKLENKKEYCVTIATIEWIIQNMDNGFLEPGAPNIIVSKLDAEIIENALNEYALEDAYWLRVFSLSYGDQIRE
jgi:hypothetical protein